MKSTRKAYGEFLVELGEKNKNVIVFDADLAAATNTSKFKDKFPERHFDIGIVLLWTSIEKIIDELWEKMLDDSDYNNTLREQTKSSSEFTANIKINELFLGKIIHLELVKKLNKARKVRNKIIHGNYSLFLYQGDINGTFTNISEKCRTVNMAASELINYVYNLNLVTPFNINTQIY